MQRKYILPLVLLTVLLSGQFNPNFCLAEAPSIPNIVLIITDDQRWDDISGVMPETESKIFQKGIEFKKAYVTTPACCPSRASIFTGQYASKHKVVGNKFILKGETIFQRVREKFFMGFIGKYLNTHSGKPVSSFDFWVGHKGGSQPYFNPRLFVNSPKERKVPGYITEILTKSAIEFIDLAAQQQKPFFLTLAFNAPHFPATPHPEDRGKFADVDLPAMSYPNFLPSQQELRDWRKPTWMVKLKRRPGVALQQIDFARRQRECLLSVDRGIGEIVQLLEDNQIINNTLIIFLSDNGLMNGEHGLNSKDIAYESAIKVPFAIRFDDRIKTPREDLHSLIANVDIPVTIAELAGTPYEDQRAGLSLEPLYEQSDPSFRPALMIEGFRKKRNSRRKVLRTPFSAIHTGRYVLIRNRRQRDELYDLQLDPFQRENLFSNPLFASTRAELEGQLKQLLLTHRGNTSFVVRGARRLRGKGIFLNYR